MRALILVDIQNDFLPGGALAVKDGDAVIPVANRVMGKFDVVVATQDWHPADHASFAASHPGRNVGEMIELDGLKQVLWPVHCVQGTRGAELAEKLDKSKIDLVFHKGTDRCIDSYSGFFDNGHRKSTGMAEWLRGRGVDEIYVLGLATDYCVKFTAMDGVSAGFKIGLIDDGCRGVNLQQGDVDTAVEEMKKAGVNVVHSAEIE